jgi:hypothetical protein
LVGRKTDLTVDFATAVRSQNFAVNSLCIQCYNRAGPLAAGYSVVPLFPQKALSPLEEKPGYDKTHAAHQQNKKNDAGHFKGLFNLLTQKIHKEKKRICTYGGGGNIVQGKNAQAQIHYARHHKKAVAHAERDKTAHDKSKNAEFPQIIPYGLKAFFGKYFGNSLAL